MTETQRIVEALHSLLYTNLHLSSPVLSGNMRSWIEIGDITPDTKEIVIYAPFYDMKKWQKDGTIVYTGETIHGKTDYAQWVNDMGAFGRHNRSEHWVNRCCYEVAQAIANEVGGTVINELPL